jgi:hypothetical protein
VASISGNIHEQTANHFAGLLPIGKKCTHIVWEIENQTKMLQNKTSGMFWLFQSITKLTCQPD